jgi:hypothetical protein
MSSSTFSNNIEKYLNSTDDNIDTFFKKIGDTDKVFLKEIKRYTKLFPTIQKDDRIHLVRAFEQNLRLFTMISTDVLKKYTDLIELYKSQ